MEQYDKLMARMAEVTHLGSTMAVLDWDQQCYMPPGGAAKRAEQTSLLGRLAHEMFTSDETGSLLAAAESGGNFAPDSDAALTLRAVRRDFDKSVKIPSSLVAELAKATTIAHEVWVTARANNDFPHFAPTLEKLLDLSRQVAEHLGYDDNIYDALLDGYEPGMKTAEVERIFGDLRPGLVSLVQAIPSATPLDSSILRRDFPVENQRIFGEFIAQKMGFDFTRGRQDKAVHPFCTSFGKDDVRITTRYDKNWLPCALMGTIHETGHALYEQGFDPKDDNLPLSGSVSLGIHESQSRLWENIVGRSRPFWNVYLPELKTQFPDVLEGVTLDQFYRAINTVSPSLIRVEADEVTYNLHIMLRFELEKELLTGSLAVKDLPAAWNQKMQDYLGIVPTTDADGCLQDVHWSAALFGYFPTYSIGTLLSAQLYDKALADNPQIAEDLAKGEFGSLLEWLREHIHRPGRRYLPAELVQRACGEPAQSHSYLNYLNQKFRTLYNV